MIPATIRKLGWQATPSATRILTNIDQRQSGLFQNSTLHAHFKVAFTRRTSFFFFFPSSILDLEIAQELGLICFYCHICSAKLFDFSVRKAFHSYVTLLGEQPSVYVAEQNNDDLYRLKCCQIDYKKTYLKVFISLRCSQCHTYLLSSRSRTLLFLSSQCSN